MGALVSLLVTIGLSLLVTRIASVALTMTGVSRDLAKFQARSAFTGVGFTTNEAEKVVARPVRRHPQRASTPSPSTTRLVPG
jgi:hypothetical protein